MNNFFNPSVLTYVDGAQKNRLLETVLLITHIICFDRSKKIICNYALLCRSLNNNHTCIWLDKCTCVDPGQLVYVGLHCFEKRVSRSLKKL